jgi:hypothetical protein
MALTRCRIGHCTRLYFPLPDSPLACRRCWGLTYASRQHRNYTDRGPLWAGFSHRDSAYVQTEEARERNYEASVKRWAERRLLRLTPSLPIPRSKSLIGFALESTRYHDPTFTTSV